METGMLWFDNDPKTDLATKITLAVIYYEEKYGYHPDLCYINPTMLGGSMLRCHKNIEVRPTSAVANHYMWIGIHQRSAASF